MFLDLSGPAGVFALALLVAALIYACGRSGSKSVGEGEEKGAKLQPYACGEQLPPERVPVSIHMFDFAAFFLIFDVIAIILIFSFSASNVLLPIAYIALSGLALYAIITYRRR
ncbi:MAG: NADH-quinone oxidoreductase subunit A [Candidatus Methanosuratincola sp.]|jgi:NADH:ubiquinone oxidoreductase subunit 3 (subunit A)